MSDSTNCIRIVGEDDVRTLIDSDSARALARRVLKDQAEGGSSLSSPSAMNRNDAPQITPGTTSNAQPVSELFMRLLSPGAFFRTSD